MLNISTFSSLVNELSIETSRCLRRLINKYHDKKTPLFHYLISVTDVEYRFVVSYGKIKDETDRFMYNLETLKLTFASITLFQIYTSVVISASEIIMLENMKKIIADVMKRFPFDINALNMDSDDFKRNIHDSLIHKFNSEISNGMS
jgi:hypothetical protein